MEKANIHYVSNRVEPSPSDWFKNWKHLGGFYPYYHQQQPQRFSTTIGSILESLPAEQLKLDPVGVIEILTKGYMLGNRTLVQGVRHAPWMAQPNEQGGWQYAQVYEHGAVKQAIPEFVVKLKAALRREALEYITGKRRIGLLLSGGMDSRIVAGVLRELELSGEYCGTIIAFTWGMINSRDVIYASQIAERYGWEWRHLPLTAEVLKSNIELSGSLGAEIAPFHVHAMARVRDMRDVEAVLAGSYGDMVGRAEFSGRHVLELQPMVPRRFNKFGLLKTEVIHKHRNEILHDAYAYRAFVHRSEEHQYREIEHHMHYTRRMLSSAMSCIGVNIPLYQLFTAPHTVSLVWALSVKLRDDRIYAELVQTLPGDLHEIPWARTGRPFGSEEGIPDEAQRQHHMYGIWLRHDLHDYVLSLVDSETIRGLGVFNEITLDWLLKLWPKAQTQTTNGLDEAIAWMASLAAFVKRYNIQSDVSELSVPLDGWHALRGYVSAWTYQVMRERLRE